jgi:glycosyltransferase involved in cell wall biosynthesis
VNIWMINHYGHPPSAPGDARHFSHARELIKRGHQVRIIACSLLHLQQESTVDIPRNATCKHTVFEGVPFTWLRAPQYEGHSIKRVWNMLTFSWRVFQMNWASGMAAPDLILGSSPHPFAALAAERLSKRFGVPFILEIRDAWPFVLTEVGGYSRHHPFVVLVDSVMRFLYRRASAIVMFSRDSQALLERYGADPKKLVWISHGVDLAMSPRPDPAPLSDIFTMTYIGAHNQWNSLDTLLDAAKLLNDTTTNHVRLRFVGSGSERARLMERARVEQITNIEFIKSVPKSEVKKLLHTSDAFILNNRVDGVSKEWMSFSKLYEYLAAGRPVVFGSCSDNDPVHESGGGLSVPADDAMALADAITQLARCSPEQRWAYGCIGRDHIEKFYSIPSLVDRFEALAERVTVV